MRRGFLIVDSPDRERRRVPVADSILIGRALDCGLVIEDAAASRHHVQISARGGDYFWKDMGSTNGTLVNGALMLEGRLRDGDRIEIGKTSLVFRSEEVPDKPVSGDTNRLFRGTIISEGGEARQAQADEKPAQLLQAVYSVMHEIATNYEVCSLTDRILETTVRAIDAQRGAILFAPLGLPDVAPCPVCGRYHVITDGRLAHVDREAVHISTTVANRVLQGGESVLYQDTDEAHDLDHAASIVSLKLRSIMCTPVRGKNDILGILYIDSTRPGQAYTQDDLLLATAVGNSAGLALENARMHTEMLEKQRMDQEIEYAWNIQQGFLVKHWPDGAGRFEVYGETRPAKTVGGDFYDVVEPRPGAVGVLIGDVSGKGVPAALTMAQLLAEFRLCAQISDSPTEVLDSLNRGMAERSQRGMFCTLSYLLLDLETGVVRCANAGHHAAVRFGKNGVTFFGEPTGPPLGVLPMAHWDEDQDRLEPAKASCCIRMALSRRATQGPCATRRMGRLNTRRSA